MCPGATGHRRTLSVGPMLKGVWYDYSRRAIRCCGQFEMPAVEVENAASGPGQITQRLDKPLSPVKTGSE